MQKNLFSVILLASCFLFTRIADAKEIDKKEIEDAVREFVLSHSGWSKEEVIVKDVGLKGVHNLNEEGVSFEVAPLRKDGVLLGRTPVLVRVKVGDDIKRTFWVTPYVEVIADVPVIKEHIEKGRLIRVEDMVIEKREISRMPRNVVLNMNDIADKTAKTDMRPGMVVTGNMLDSVKLVKRGEPVTILAGSASLMVTAVGQAKEDGSKDSFVKVLNPASKKVIIGKVVDKSTVTVFFE